MRHIEAAIETLTRTASAYEEAVAASNYAEENPHDTQRHYYAINCWEKALDEAEWNGDVSGMSEARNRIREHEDAVANKHSRPYMEMGEDASVTPSLQGSQRRQASRLQRLGPNQTMITKNDGTIVFYSYDTPVAVVKVNDEDGRDVLYVTDQKFSVTTSKHITKFKQYIGFTYGATVPQAEIEQMAQ